MTAHRPLWWRPTTVFGATIILVVIVAMTARAGTTHPEDTKTPSAAWEGPVPRTGLMQETSTIYLPYGTIGGRYSICTVGAIIGRTAYTAGHCGRVGDPVFLSDSAGVPVGTVIAAGAADDDIATIALLDTTPVGAASTLDASELTRGTALTAIGAASGRTTGFLTGATLQPFHLVGTDDQPLGTRPGLGLPTSLCVARGDSGAPVYLSGSSTIVGIVIAVATRHDPNDCRSFMAPIEWVR